MKVKVQLMRTVMVPTQELAWSLFRHDLKPVGKDQCEEALRKKYGPSANGIRFFWNFGDLSALPNQTVVGIEVMRFDVSEADHPQEGLIEADFLNQEEVLRREGALVSELERIGIYLMPSTDGSPYEWRVVYELEGN